MAIISMDKVKEKANKGMVYQLRIDLEGAKPPIWRRILIEADKSFFDLHMIIQHSFDWEDCHLHDFITSDRKIILNFNDEGYQPSLFKKEYNEEEMTLFQILKVVGDKVHYNYDFGDDWRHKIKLEKILEKDGKKIYPHIVTGKRVAPFEDCGGIGAWEYICEVARDENHPGREELLEDFEDFEKFNPDMSIKKEMKFRNASIKITNSVMKSLNPEQMENLLKNMEEENEEEIIKIMEIAARNMLEKGEN